MSTLGVPTHLPSKLIAQIQPTSKTRQVMNIRHEIQTNQRTAQRRFILLALASLVVLIIASLSAASKSSTLAESKSSVTEMPLVTYQEIPSGRPDVRRFKALFSTSNSEEPISIKSWMESVASKSPQGIQAASDLSDIISTCQYPSILFETMGTSWRNSDATTFEFALVDMPALKRFAEGNPDRGAFDEHFRKCFDENAITVCSFDNLGGDARLVSPLPQNGVDDSTYSHIAAFVRNAPKTQIQEFWAEGAQQYLNELQRGGTKWFSTNGMGVAWLHLRLDSRPKYYSYDPFTVAR